MFIDLCPGEWIRIGDATLLVLEVEGSRVQFALEGVDLVPAGGEGVREARSHDTVSAQSRR